MRAFPSTSNAMTLHRTCGVLRAFVLGMCTLALQGAAAQGFPDRPLRIVAPGPAGSGIDLVARIIADRLRDDFGQPVLVENRPGADGIVAARQVAIAPPDGYMLLLASPSQMSVNPVLYRNLSYDPQRDFVPIGMVAQVPFVFVANPAIPANSMQELAAYAKAHPEALNYGAGSSIFMLATESIRMLTDMPMRHIPYNGIPPVVTALLAGTVQVGIVNLSVSVAHIKSGALKAFATMGQTRDPLLPGVPTIAEAGVRGYEIPAWMGVFAPSGMAPEVVVRLQSALARAVAAPETRDRLRAAGFVPMGSTGPALADAILRETGHFRAIAKSAGLQPN